MRGRRFRLNADLRHAEEPFFGDEAAPIQIPYSSPGLE